MQPASFRQKLSWKDIFKADFCDSGYFDNSGSGVVSEMINILLRDSSYLIYKEKIRFYILQIINAPSGESLIKKSEPPGK